MNIFYLDADPAAAAAAHCDKHVVKMVVECSQLLGTAHRLLDGVDEPAPAPGEAGYPKIISRNHPCSVWTRAASDNYHYVWTLYVLLAQEYRKRYGREHASARHIPVLQLRPRNIPYGPVTERPQCFGPNGDRYKQPDTVAAYRAYYIGEKAGFARWQYTPAPAWWPAA